MLSVWLRLNFVVALVFVLIWAVCCFELRVVLLFVLRFTLCLCLSVDFLSDVDAVV